MVEEAVLEKARSDGGIGTTMRGIGTCYRDKAGRTHAIRVGDMYRPQSFRERLSEIVAHKNLILKALDPGLTPLNAEAIYAEYSRYAERLAPHVTNTAERLHRELAAGKRLLFEGRREVCWTSTTARFPT